MSTVAVGSGAKHSRIWKGDTSRIAFWLHECLAAVSFLRCLATLNLGLFICKIKKLRFSLLWSTMARTLLTEGGHFHIRSPFPLISRGRGNSYFSFHTTRFYTLSPPLWDARRKRRHQPKKDHPVSLWSVHIRGFGKSDAAPGSALFHSGVWTSWSHWQRWLFSWHCHGKGEPAPAGLPSWEMFS